MRVADLPIIFLSYDEPWSDEFYGDLKFKAPWAKRVHGVKGLDACHKQAAKIADNEWFITVDADTLVEADFFEVNIPDEFMNDSCRIEWGSLNNANGLTYGNGSLKCWPAKLICSMRSHEAAPSGTISLDHDLGRIVNGRPVGHRISIDNVYSVTMPAQTPYHAFRCGFREAVRLSSHAYDAGINGKARWPANLEVEATPLDRSDRSSARYAWLPRWLTTRSSSSRRAVDPPVNMLENLPEWQSSRLQIWCTIGAHLQNGLWMIYGARLGTLARSDSRWNHATINCFEWFDELWEKYIVADELGTGNRCHYTGLEWDDDLLAHKVQKVGDILEKRLGLPSSNIDGELSSFIYGCIKGSRSLGSVDILGNMYSQGHGVKMDQQRALEYFQVGSILGLSNSVNNLARMYHRQLVPDGSIEDAINIYEYAIALENKFSPYHLATLLDTHPVNGRVDERRIAELKALSRARGFDPQ